MIVEGAKQTTKDLERSITSYRLLSQKLQVAMERDRSHIARYIHDVLSNNLTSMMLDLHSIGVRLHEEHPDVRQQFVNLSNRLTEILASVRNLITDIRPGVLDHLGLYEAIKWQLKDFSKRAGVKTQIAEFIDGPSLNPDQTTAVFRVFQEALTNVAKHSLATEVTVSVKVVEDELRITVRDNGVGIDPTALESLESFGLLGMRERMNYVGGNLSIERVSDGGTAVRIQVSLI
jgi:two-component system, NarL family, sensor histidine kinase UhpB